ncbi:MAG: hypothetical protein ACOC4C_05840 [Fibrobacterota bacterium]
MRIYRYMTIIVVVFIALLFCNTPTGNKDSEWTVPQSIDEIAGLWVNNCYNLVMSSREIDSEPLVVPPESRYYFEFEGDTLFYIESLSGDSCYKRFASHVDLDDGWLQWGSERQFAVEMNSGSMRLYEFLDSSGNGLILYFSKQKDTFLVPICADTEGLSKREFDSMPMLPEKK